MDGFRLDALALLIEGTRLDTTQARLALRTYQQKLKVYRQGALRRERHAEVARRDQQHSRLREILSQRLGKNV